ncbi:MAG: endospore germination permease [Hyphomonadaceae bacterium]|nr:endospore germination permease [Clostridia bacterium]
MNEGHFGKMEAISLMSILMIGKLFYTTPSILVQYTGTAAWYVTCVSAIITAFFFWIGYQLIKRFEGLPLDEIFEIVYGKWLGKTVLMIFVIYLVYLAGTSLREFVEMIKIYTLPTTPYSFIIVPFLAVCALMAYYGIENIARISYFSFYITLGAVVIILVLSIPKYSLEAIYPIFGYGVDKSLWFGFLRSSAYSEIMLILFLPKILQTTKLVAHVGKVTILIAVTTFSLAILGYLMVFGYSMGGEQLSGLFQLSKTIFLNRYVQRVESLFVFPWVLVSLITVAISLYLAVSFYCKAFTIKNHRPIIFPMAAWVFIVTSLPASFSELLEVNIKVLREYSMIWMYGIPVITLLVAMMRGQKGASLHEQEN